MDVNWSHPLRCAQARDILKVNLIFLAIPNNIENWIRKLPSLSENPANQPFDLSGELSKGKSSNWLNLYFIFS